MAGRLAGALWKRRGEGLGVAKQGRAGLGIGREGRHEIDERNDIKPTHPDGICKPQPRVMFGGAHAGARDLLSCCKRLDAPPQMTQDEALAGECDGVRCWASIYPLYHTAPMISLKQTG